MIKSKLAIDYKVMPLEGLWWADDMSKYGFVVSEVEEGAREGCGSCWQTPCRGSLLDLEEGRTLQGSRA